MKHGQTSPALQPGDDEWLKWQNLHRHTEQLRLTLETLTVLVSYLAKDVERMAPGREPGTDQPAGPPSE